MKRRSIIVLALAAASCGKKEDAKTDDKATQEASSPSKTDTTGHKAECPMMTKPIASGESTLKLTLDGADVPIALDVAADYPENPLSAAGAAPAACGLLETDGSLTLILQFHDGGTPVFKLQATGLRAGGTLGDDVSLVAWLRDGDSKQTLSLDKGTLTLTPTPPAAGRITVELADVTGSSFGKGAMKKVTLAGTLTLDVAAR